MDLVFDPGAPIQYRMGPEPDTLINGVIYKRIDGYYDYGYLGGEGMTGPYFVRSAADGKGFIYLPDSTAEYLTGDLNAVAGDTVWVFIGVGDLQRSAIVYSVEAIIEDGIEVIRTNVMVAGGLRFWQTGSGTSTGPFTWPTAISGPDERCIIINDAVMFNRSNDGLPGGPPCCVPLFLDVADQNNIPTLRPAPNPSNGLFTLSTASNLTDQVLVCDPHGREVLRTREKTIDLGAHPPGVYTAVVTTAQGRQAVRLVLLR